MCEKEWCQLQFMFRHWLQPFQLHHASRLLTMWLVRRGSSIRHSTSSSDAWRQKGSMRQCSGDLCAVQRTVARAVSAC